MSEICNKHYGDFNAFCFKIFIVDVIQKFFLQIRKMKFGDK